MKILIVTNMYPTPQNPNFGIFVKEQVESLKNEGIEADIMFINGKKSSFNYLRGIVQVLARVLNNEYDLIHAHYGLSGIIARVQWKYPLVVSFHGSDVNLHLQGFTSRILARHINKSIVMSSELKKRLKAKNAEVIPCGINLSLMVPMPTEYAKKELNLNLNSHYLLFPGDPENRAKGYKLFSQVVQLLQNKNLTVKKLVLNNIPYKKVPFYYNSASVMVFTSAKEGSPMVVKEALACNLPIVSVKVGDVAKRLHCIDGCWLAKRDANAIADKVELAIKKGRLKDGRDKVKSLALEIIAKRIINLYKSI